MRAGAADRLGDQAPGAAGDVEHRGVELHELHVAELRTRSPGHRHAVAARTGRVRRLAVELTRAAGGEDRPPCPDDRLAVGGIPDERTTAAFCVGHQVDRERVGPDREVVEPAGLPDHRPHHLAAGRVAERVHDAVVAVSPFTAEFERAIRRVEPCAPVDQFADPARRLADHGVDHVLVAEAAPGGERVGDMVIEAVLGIDDSSDAPLGPLARRAGEVILRDHRHGEAAIDRQRRAETGEAPAEHQHVGEAVRHPLGAERHEIPRSLERFAHSPLVPRR